MTKQYKKKAGIGKLVLPPHGLVREHHVLSGEQWAKYCPALLEEVKEVAASKKVAPPLPKPRVPVKPDPKPDPKPELPDIEPELITENMVEFEIKIEEPVPESKESRRGRRGKADSKE